MFYCYQWSLQLKTAMNCTYRYMFLEFCQNVFPVSSSCYITLLRLQLSLVLLAVQKSHTYPPHPNIIIQIFTRPQRWRCFGHIYLISRIPTRLSKPPNPAFLTITYRSTWSRDTRTPSGWTTLEVPGCQRARRGSLLPSMGLSLCFLILSNERHWNSSRPKSQR